MPTKRRTLLPAEKADAAIADADVDTGSRAGEGEMDGKARRATVNPVEFSQFPETTPAESGRDIALLLDVVLNLTVELGRTRMSVRDVLGLGPGSVVELDKLAGEPVDIFVNGTCIAKGEVVVVDEKFGVRVTEIISPARRIATAV